MKRINIKLEPEIHRRLKMKAIQEATTIQATVVHLIRQWLNPTSLTG